MLTITSRSISQNIPASIEIFRGPYGLSVRAKKRFLANEIIDPSVSFCFIPSDDTYYSLFLNDSVDAISLHSITNTLLYTDKERVCNGYIGYVNHHCSQSNIKYCGSSDFSFSMIARRDIECGEELTSNYHLFDYTGDGHEFTCMCSEGDLCCGRFGGFRSLPYDTQYKLLSEVTTNVLQQFLSDNYNAADLAEVYHVEKFQESFCPSAVAVGYESSFHGGNQM